MELKLEGVYPVIPTPFLDNDEVDINGLGSILEYVLEKKFQGVLILGSNGEAPYLSFAEKVQIIKTASKVLKNKINLIVGTGSFSTKETLELTKIAKEEKATAALIILPIFYPLTFHNIYAHYRYIAKESKFPIMYYNFPPCSHLHLSNREIVKLSIIEGMVGIKESILNLKDIKYHIDNAYSESFNVFSGTTYLFSEVMRLGGAGVICPANLLTPEPALKIFELISKNKNANVDEYEKEIFKTLPIMGKVVGNTSLSKKLLKFAAKAGIPLNATGGTPQALFKEALRLQGIPIKPRVRKPLPQLSNIGKSLVEKVITSLEK